MINLTLRSSAEISFFKQNLIKLCSTLGDTLILSYGYFDENFSRISLSNLLSHLSNKLSISGTKKIYIIGGQLSIPSFSNLSDEQKNIFLNDEAQRISNILKNLTNKLNKNLSKSSNIEIEYLYRARFHAKLAIKFNSNFTDNISILIGSSNLTAPSIIDGVNLDYHNIESDIFLTDINPNKIAFNNECSNIAFHSFINSIICKNPSDLTIPDSSNFDQ